MDASTDQSLKGLMWDSAQVRKVKKRKWSSFYIYLKYQIIYLHFLVDFDFQVAASGESQYDDAFTIQRVEKCQVDEFNYVAGMVPFLLNLVKDVREL